MAREEFIPLFKEFRWVNAYQDFDERNFYFAFTLPHENISDGTIVPKVLVATKHGLLSPERVMKDFGIQFKTLKIFDVEWQPIDVRLLEKFNELVDKVNDDIKKWEDLIALDSDKEEVLDFFGITNKEQQKEPKNLNMSVEKCSRVEIFWSTFFLYNSINFYLPILIETLQKYPNLFGEILNSIKEFQGLVEKCREKIDEKLLYSTYHLYKLYKEFPKLLKQLIATIVDYYIDYEDERMAVELASTWAIGTYVFVLFDHYPYLNFWGEKGTGKTKNLEVLQCLAFNPISGTSFSGPASFRLVETYRPTVLIDETHQITRNHLEIS